MKDFSLADVLKNEKSIIQLKKLRELKELRKQQEKERKKIKKKKSIKKKKKISRKNKPKKEEKIELKTRRCLKKRPKFEDLLDRDMKSIKESKASINELIAFIRYILRSAEQELEKFHQSYSENLNHSLAQKMEALNRSLIQPFIKKSPELRFEILKLNNKNPLKERITYDRKKYNLELDVIPFFSFVVKQNLILRTISKNYRFLLEHTEADIEKLKFLPFPIEDEISYFEHLVYEDNDRLKDRFYNLLKLIRRMKKENMVIHTKIFQKVLFLLYEKLIRLYFELKYSEIPLKDLLKNQNIQEEEKAIDENNKSNENTENLKNIFNLQDKGKIKKVLFYSKIAENDEILKELNTLKKYMTEDLFPFNDYTQNLINFNQIWNNSFTNFIKNAMSEIEKISNENKNNDNINQNVDKDKERND